MARWVDNGNWRREIEDATEDLLRTVADDIADDARRFAPVDTGKMKGSIHAGRVTGNTVYVEASAEYSGYVELGTRYMDAQPFLRPALYRTRTYGGA